MEDFLVCPTCGAFVWAHDPIRDTHIRWHAKHGEEVGRNWGRVQVKGGADR